MLPARDDVGEGQGVSVRWVSQWWLADQHPGAPKDFVQTVFDTPQGMIEHLDAHVAVGHSVPERAFERLRREAAEPEAE